MYNELYVAWLHETDEPALQPLPSDFYARISDYIQKITEEIKLLDKKALKAALLEQELKNVKLIVKQLTWIRYKKMVKFVNSNQKLQSTLLTAEEAELSKGYLPFVEGYRAFVKTLLHGQTQKINLQAPVEPSTKMVTLRFVKAVPAVIGGDMKTYGPFVPEDVASLPVGNAQILVKQGYAKLVEVS